MQQLGEPGFYHVIARYGYAQRKLQGAEFVKVRWRLRHTLDRSSPAMQTAKPGLACQNAVCRLQFDSILPHILSHAHMSKRALWDV